MKKTLFILFTLTIFAGMFAFASPHDKPHDPHPAVPRHAPPPPRHAPPRRDPTRPPPGWYAEKHPHMKAWEEHERWDLYEEHARLYVEFRDNNVSKILYKLMVDLDACREKLAEAVANNDEFDIAFYQQ